MKIPVNECKIVMMTAREAEQILFRGEMVKVQTGGSVPMENLRDQCLKVNIPAMVSWRPPKTRT